MTCGLGTKSIPKDYKFENILRANLTQEKFDKIIYYDTCLIAKSSKLYGKIIVGDDCIYSFIEHGKEFSILTEFKNIIRLDLVTDVPTFIIGPMQDNCIHLKLIYYKLNSNISKQKIQERINYPSCCKPFNKEEPIEDLKPMLSTNTLSTMNGTDRQSRKVSFNLEDFSIESVDIYVLNKYSPILSLFKKANVDYMIRQTLKYSSDLANNYRLSHKLINDLFEGLMRDISLTIHCINVHRDFLMELIESGHRYMRIKILFWSKPDMFGFLAEQFTERVDILLSIDSSNIVQQTQSIQSAKKLTATCLDCTNVLLKVFNIFMFQTDHLQSKWEQLRKNNATLTISLVKRVLQLIAYLNKHDRCDSPDLQTSNIDLDIDCVKYEITINSVQLFYNLICSSQVPFSDEGTNPFTICTVSNIVGSLLSVDNDEAIFNAFVDQVLRMIFIWLFPDMHKIDEKIILSPENVVTIFQFFESLRVLVHCVPKLMPILRRAMKEEFHYFVMCDITFSQDYLLSSPTVQLLKLFQKNMTESNDVFIN